MYGVNYNTVHVLVSQRFIYCEVLYFCSNSGGNAIASFTLDRWKNGERDQIKLKDVESLLMKTVFNEKGMWGCLLNHLF